MSEDVLLGVRVPPELKALVDADQRTNQELVRDALWTEFGGRRKSALNRRKDELDEHIDMLQRQRQARKEEIDELRQERQELLDALETRQDQIKSVVAEAVETMDIHPSEGHDHAAAENWAGKIDLSAEEFWERYTARWEEVNGDE